MEWRRGQSAPNSPQGVHRVSAANPPGNRGSPPNQACHLDVVVAACRIPQDVVFLGLDWGRAAAYIPAVGRVAGKARTAPKRPAERWSNRRRKTLVGGTSTEHSQLSSPPPQPAARSLGRRPDRGGRGVGPGERRDGPAADGRSAGPPSESPSGPPLRAVSNASWRPAARDSHRGPRRNHAAPRNRPTQPRRRPQPQRNTAMNERTGRAQRGAGNESSRLERVPRHRDHDRDRPCGVGFCRYHGDCRRHQTGQGARPRHG
jgi:hypothetical protein